MTQCDHGCLATDEGTICVCTEGSILQPDGQSCRDSEDGESADSFSLKNKTLNDESLLLPVPGLSTDGEEDNMDEGSEPTLFIEKMVSDQDDCFSLRCDVNAQCLLDGGNPTCHCLEGFTGDGELCVDRDECMLGMALCSSQSSVCVNTAGGYYCQCRPGFSGEGHHCTDIDECKMGTHKCDERAECVNTIGKYRCMCQAGYSGNGQTCQELSTMSSWVTTSRPMDVTSQWVNTNTVESCPSSHETYCLYEGVCFYFPEMESYACKQVPLSTSFCIAGYMGERCQFSDLEWWELQQAEQEKRRNVAIALGMVVLITLLSIAACITYCYGRSVRKHPSVDDMSETSTSDDTMSETTVPKMPRFYVVLEHGGDGKDIHIMGCESFVSEEALTLPRHNRGYECSFGLATMETNKTSANHLKSIDNLIFLDEPQPVSAVPQLT
ncbi:unnamed protein product [Coregonus sp. 'balchen']|nr:unnamed protein product [Coregonus sp. 'balchen']